MWVVKLGGSLLQGPRLMEWLLAFRHFPDRNAVVVTGGGAFADQVRRVQARTGMDDRLAHHLALIAMEQVAWLCHSMAPWLVPVRDRRQLAEVQSRGDIAVLLPTNFLAPETGLPRDWSLTSDSIAAWFAAAINAEHLCIVKSCALPAHYTTTAELENAGIVDAAFPHLVQSFHGDIRFYTAAHVCTFLSDINRASMSDPLPL